MANVTVKIGDMFQSDAQTLVNTVNCVGVMGRGVALEFRKRFPAMFKDYVARCQAGQLRLGETYLFKDLVGKWVVNFPTKDHWRSVSKLSDIVAGLDHLYTHYKNWGIRSLAVPPLGCGNGQLDWNVVGPTLYRHLSRLNIPVELYAPLGTPAEQLTPAFLGGTGQRMLTRRIRPDDIHISAAAVALVGIVSRITREPYHWPIGRTMFQKIAYFATESGLPTGLVYQRGSYGPFATDLKRLITRLVNNGLLVETKRGSMFEVRPGPTYPDARGRYKEQLKTWAATVEKVADLFLRLQRTAEAEIAATVHFAARDLSAAQRPTDRPSEIEVFSEVKAWKARRNPPLQDEQLAASIRYLNVLGWVQLRGSPELNVRDPEDIFA